MCTPALALGLGASAVGSYLNGREQNAQARRTFQAQQDAADAELARQHGYQADAGQQFAETLAGFNPGAQRGNLASAQQKRDNTIQSAITIPSTGGVAPGSAPDMVKSEVARKSGQGVAAARASGTALANLGGWDDLNLGNNVALTRGGQRLGTIGDAAAGSSRLLPIDMKAAATNSYRAPNPLGDLLTLGGQGLSLYGMYGGGDPSFGDLFNYRKPIPTSFNYRKPIPTSFNAVSGMSAGRV